MLYGCDETVSRGDAASIEVKPACDILIRYIVNYCLSHMKDNLIRIMLKAQSDIMAIKTNAVATLPKETLLSRCEANQGFKFSPATADLMMKMPLETLRKICS